VCGRLHTCTNVFYRSSSTSISHTHTHTHTHTRTHAHAQAYIDDQKDHLELLEAFPSVELPFDVFLHVVPKLAHNPRCAQCVCVCVCVVVAVVVLACVSAHPPSVFFSHPHTHTHTRRYYTISSSASANVDRISVTVVISEAKKPRNRVYKGVCRYGVYVYVCVCG
jgi:sulfite reductase alpha subunit-like flavoprotein